MYRTPDNKYLRMYAPGSVSAPYDILDSDTGIAKQIGDLKVEPQRNTAWANRVTLVVKGGGPPTSQETFTAADGVSSGGFTRFTTKYPASASQNDFWTNQLRFDGVVQGAIAFGEEHLVANGGLVTWAWNPTTHQLVYDEATLEQVAVQDGAYGGHHLGTARMSASPENGVVDGDCKVHGIGNLYIASCAVMPTSSQANPTLSIIAFAVRLAEHLAAQAAQAPQIRQEIARAS